MTSARPAALSRHGRAGAVTAPAVYRPKAHPGAPRRWNSELVLHALQAWVTETGSPPRRVDWSGEDAPAAGAAQRKWIAEHPRWPSSSCVASHFGSWSAALKAANLPARTLTFPTTVSDRVATARRLAADGQPIAEIARDLGVSKSTVYNYLNASLCPDCGGPVSKPTAARCRTCTKHDPTTARSWTRDGVREAIRDWALQTGRAPRYHEWTPDRSSPGRWEADSPRWPSAAVVCALYDSHHDPWNAALTDAGVDITLRRWDDRSLRTALADFWIQTGHPPKPADLRTAAGWSGPHPVTLRRRYGSLANAWEALGPAPSAS